MSVSMHTRGHNKQSNQKRKEIGVSAGHAETRPDGKGFVHKGEKIMHPRTLGQEV
jgi:hypothetical protein